MLVLSRKVGETIIIEGDIKITVVSVRSDGKVSLGIDAPACISVDREEIYKLKSSGNVAGD